MRLIDADTMREDWLENGENEYVYDTNAVLDSIDDQPTVDAVPVVRCKDCRYSKRKGNLYECPFFDEIRPDEYCSSGERKDK